MKTDAIQISMFYTQRVKEAITRLKMVNSPDDPLWVSTSKGKDSLAIETLCELAGVNYEKHYTLTSVDPPEIVQMAIADKDCIIDKPRDSEGKQITMWNLIPRKKMPPTRMVRYCCSIFKEGFGVGRKVVTGVRKEESLSRAQNGGEVKILNAKTISKIKRTENVNFQSTPKGGVILNLDNHENRRFIEQCYRTSKMLINPIIDWTERDVWELLRGEGVRYPSLYDKGFKRLGCIGCPLGGCNGQRKDFEMFPTYKQNYISTFDRMLKVRRDEGIPTEWQSGEEVFDWWTSDRREKEECIPEGQEDWFEELGL